MLPQDGYLMQRSAEVDDEDDIVCIFKNQFEEAVIDCCDQLAQERKKQMLPQDGHLMQGSVVVDEEDDIVCVLTTRLRKLCRRLQ